MTKFLRTLWQDESGQDLAEYTMLIVLIAIFCIGAVTALGEGIEGGLQDAATRLFTGGGGEGGADGT